MNYSMRSTIKIPIPDWNKRVSRDIAFGLLCPPHDFNENKGTYKDTRGREWKIIETDIVNETPVFVAVWKGQDNRYHPALFVQSKTIWMTSIDGPFATNKLRDAYRGWI